MRYPITLLAAESAENADARPVQRVLSELSSLMSEFGVNPPAEFLQRLDAFAKRNSVPIEFAPDRNSMRCCCLRCLKAYALTEASYENLPSNVIFAVDQGLPCEAGHNGYFLKEGEVCKLVS